MNRFTFVVQIQPEGPSTLENLATRERVRISDLELLGPQIEQWMRSLDVDTESETNEGRTSDEEAR